MTPGDRLRLARTLAGYKSAAAAAAALGMTDAAYRGHENGTDSFTGEQAERYAAAFDTEAGWLMFGDDLSGPEVTAGAVAMSSAAILAALVQSLHEKGVLSDEETVEVYEQALLLLEMQQAKANVNPAFGQVVAMARELIEQHLRPA